MKDLLRARLAKNGGEEEPLSDGEEEGTVNFKKDLRKIMLEACENDNERRLILEMIKVSQEENIDPLEPELNVNLVNLVSNEEYEKYL
mmetsp:Transcript_21844/g.33835  ORF Transcript_21844/g.33835 Transcript_21844/m.33835 type:complete len:88 (+) Transcript_21844:3234-3497(+)